MAGIYIHIPFCRQACYYCDFHFSTSLKNKKDFLEALKKEIYLQKDYLETKNISSVYFGGGTPSVLSHEEILDIFSELADYFSIDLNAEITLEANPDDLSKEKLKELYQTPINRLSIGIQSFSDEDLLFLNRIHDSECAITSVKEAQNAGFKNITIDLIYGIQTLSNEQWKKNIKQAIALDVQHLSCYSLTIEPKTALAAFINKGKALNINSEKSAEQFEVLMDEMEKNDFIHYEISNFCKEGFYSRHNSSYWMGEKYLGLGPSAHSFDGGSRQWNVSSNSNYISCLHKNNIPFEKEILSENQKYNEYILTSLRTIWGADIKFVKKNFSEEISSHFSASSLRAQQSNLIERKSDKLLLTRKGKLFADTIARELFVT
ncbi:MAG: radical SAM family heme chaperone HemW [Bacteroidetes bacterium]|nr:radical SAM family heme chaperone HemW [Bacteroidota bacterium]